MTEPSSPFRMSQGYEVLQPKAGTAYPVPCDEWEFLKSKLGQISAAPWVYHTVGSLLAGAAVTTFVTILTGTFPSPPQSSALVIAWAVVAVGIIGATACFFFADQQRQIQSVRVSDVITQMELIERRYESVTRSEQSASQTLKIIAARYGADGKFLDLTSLLTKRVTTTGLHVVADNSLAGDPCKNVPKELIVEFEHQGRRLTKTVKEHEVLSLP